MLREASRAQKLRRRQPSAEFLVWENLAPVVLHCGGVCRFVMKPRRVVYWEWKVTAIAGLLLAFSIEAADSGLALPASQVSNAMINLPIRSAADCCGTVTCRFRSCSRN